MAGTTKRIRTVANKIPNPKLNTEKKILFLVEKKKVDAITTHHIIHICAAYLLNTPSFLINNNLLLLQKQTGAIETESITGTLFALFFVAFRDDAPILPFAKKEATTTTLNEDEDDDENNAASHPHSGWHRAAAHSRVDNVDDDDKNLGRAKAHRGGSVGRSSRRAVVEHGSDAPAAQYHQHQ